MTFQRILFPVDFSNRGHAAARYVRGMAESFHSKVTLVHAVADPVKWYGERDPIKAAEIDLPRVLKEAEQSLRQFAEAEFPGDEIALVSELDDSAELIEGDRSPTSAGSLPMSPVYS